MIYAVFGQGYSYIYTSKKIEFDSKNNDGGGELAYFWLADSQFYFKFQLEYIPY